jgi:hypothetical protein
MQIFSACCLAWGLGAATVVAALDKDGTLHQLYALLHRHGGTR